MMEILIMCFQKGLIGSVWSDQALYNALPLRVYDSEKFLEEPDDFWDPVGFWSARKVDPLRRRRVVEVKHGRISMLATTGYATPQISRTFPGYLLSARVMRATWAGAAASRRASRVMATIAQLAKVRAV